jgi:hypothetical protein
MPVHLGLAAEARNHSLTPGFLFGCSPRPFGTHSICIGLSNGYRFAGEGGVWLSGQRMLPSLAKLLDSPFRLDPSDRHHMAAVMQAESRPSKYEYPVISGD